MTLRLAKIDDIDSTWINGHLVGSMLRWDAARAYRVSGDVLRPGTNTIAIRVYDNLGPGGVYGKADEISIGPVDDAAKQIALAGEWRFKACAAKKNLPPFPEWIGENPHVVTVLYNGMLAPLTPFAIKGTIWYQGESNAGRAAQYRRLLPTMIEDWRNRFGQGDFPFFVVQLANFQKRQESPSEGGWAEIREAQALAAAADPLVGLVVTTDIGEADDIHPRNKQDVGQRLALSALKIAYGRDVVHTGPTFREMQVEGPKARLKFDGVGGGLEARDATLTGFAIAGADKQFVWAHAVIDGETVLVSSPEVEVPVAVRYNWANNPIGNLYNRAGLPAAPFRTDIDE